jgi:hypothetical protein
MTRARRLGEIAIGILAVAALGLLVDAAVEGTLGVDAARRGSDNPLLPSRGSGASSERFLATRWTVDRRLPPAPARAASRRHARGTTRATPAAAAPLPQPPATPVAVAAPPPSTPVVQQPPAAPPPRAAPRSSPRHHTAPPPVQFDEHGSTPGGQFDDSGTPPPSH